MENERRARQIPSRYASQQGLFPPQVSHPGVTAPPTLPSSGSRAQGYGYGYGEGSQFASSLQPSGVSYGAQDYAADQQHQAQRPTQQYAPYGQNVMYNVSGTQGSAPGSSHYEPVEPYQQNNRDSAMPVLSTGFAVAQAQPYFEGGPTSVPVSSSVPSQFSSLGYTSTQAHVGREALAPAYSAPAMTDAHPSGQGSYSQGYSEPHGSGNEYDDFYNNYQTELKKTFEYVRDGRLSEAGLQLYRLSDWLLHWAETLGLVRDDETHYQQRLKLWEEFNTCWLATLQKQKSATEDMISTGQRAQPPQSLIDYDALEKMGTQLVKNCDAMEKHGLVDYQMGVWEEEIVAMLTCCLDLLEELGGGASTQQPSTTRRR